MTGKEVPLARLYESLQGVNKLEPAPVPTELEEMEKILKENKYYSEVFLTTFFKGKTIRLIV